MPKGMRGFQKGISVGVPFKKGHKLNIGRKLSEETKKKIGLKSIGRIHSEETRKKMSESRKKYLNNHEISEITRKKLSEINKGRRLTPEWRYKISQSLKGRFTGPESNTWKDGKNINYWKRECLRRDQFTCQDCGNNDERVLTVDHIKSKKMYPELQFSIDNGRTLCANCHLIKTNEDEEYRNWMYEKYWKFNKNHNN